MNETLLVIALAAAGFAPRIKSRVELSLAKHRSLSGHPRMERRLAALVPHYEYDEADFFRSDDAPDEVAARRRAGFLRLAALYRERYATGAGLSAEVVDSISDLQFTDAYRVPFQYSRHVRRHLGGGAFMASSAGVRLRDPDGNEFYDLAGSYGVNLFGYDFYKTCLARGGEQAHALGPVLGPYHPVVADNVARLKAISGLDEVSFHMSGTEAVMQAVRLARYHTRRTHLVRFCGAYHGWGGDVQPGAGNPVPAHETYTLKDMDEDSLRVLRRRRDIACVLVNPLQALHPNSAAASDSTLIDSSRKARFDREAYTAWLRRLREVCAGRNIVLIMDEVFLGFRIARGGAQEYFGVRADLVTYGKTLGGGLPIGVICGRKDLMKRFRDDRPADISFARGTFNSHPYVMTAMNQFLRHLDEPAVRELYRGIDGVWNDRAARLNRRLCDEQLPLQVANLSSVFTVLYTTPSRYNWMLQYYLRAEGIALSWVGTGRLIFSHNYTDPDFDDVTGRFAAAAKAMLHDGWWWSAPTLTNRSIRRRVLREMFSHFFRRTVAPR